MEEKRMTESESLALITEMISRTKERYIGDGNIMLMWGYLTVAVGVLVWVLLNATGNLNWNLCWLLIPLIGGIASPIMSRRHKAKCGVKSYSDRVSSHIWFVVIIYAIVAMLFNLGFGILAHIATGAVMLIFALVIVPFAEVVQGIIVKEKSLIIGGAVGLFIGIFTLCCIVGDVAIKVNWFMPLFIVAFICMMIVPGHIINYKTRQLR